MLYSHTVPLTILILLVPPSSHHPFQTTLPIRCLQTYRVARSHLRLRPGRVVDLLYLEVLVAQLHRCRPLAPLRPTPLLRLPLEAHLHLLRHHRPRHLVEVHQLLHPRPLAEDRPLKRLDLPRPTATPLEAAHLAHLHLGLPHPMRRRHRPLVRRQAMHRLLLLRSEEVLPQEDSDQVLPPALHLANTNRPLALQRALLRAHSVRRQPPRPQPRGAEPSSSMERLPAKCSRPSTSRKTHRS